MPWTIDITSGETHRRVQRPDWPAVRVVMEKMLPLLAGAAHGALLVRELDTCDAPACLFYVVGGENWCINTQLELDDTPWEKGMPIAPGMGAGTTVVEGEQDGPGGQETEEDAV